MTSMKNVQFLHPLPLFLSELSKSPRPLMSKLRLPNLPKCLYNSQQLFTTKNQFKLNSVFCIKIQASSLTWNAKNKTKMLSKAEPDTCLEHLYQNQAPVWKTVRTLITLILIIAVDIQFLRIPSPPSIL